VASLAHLALLPAPLVEQGFGEVASYWHRRLVQAKHYFNWRMSNLAYDFVFLDYLAGVFLGRLVKIASDSVEVVEIVAVLVYLFGFFFGGSLQTHARTRGVASLKHRAGSWNFLEILLLASKACP